MTERPLIREDHISQIPALQLLMNLGWQYLSPAETLAQRGGRMSGVLLEGILAEQLARINRIRNRSSQFPFSDGNIHTAVQGLKDFMFDGLVRTNEKVYDLLCLGRSLQQTIEGDRKSYSLRYIDWEHPERNVYHVTEEFSVERVGSKESYRPDIVLFVNGIPLVIVECKRLDLGPGHDPIDQAISQHLRNQQFDGIPNLFQYAQVLLAVSVSQAKYGTVGTPASFWAKWRESQDHEAEIKEAVCKPLSAESKDKLFSDRFAYVREHFNALEAAGGRETTEQDRLVWALCRPERLLELSYRYVLFDAGVRKIARYQQYFAVKTIMQRIRAFDGGSRRGGVVWHTQGSGKSLTMVMLAKAIALESEIPDHKIILVTDRVDLDDQIYKTFGHCGIEIDQATTGSHLVDLLRHGKAPVIATVINKFEAVAGKHNVRIEDPNIFVLVDEGHRTQYGPLHAKMEKTLPKACLIAFTGTPIAKRFRNTLQKFGGLVQPVYTITQAVEDQAVVPLLYEGRHVREKVDPKVIDSWFDRFTEDLTDEQRADLKRKHARADMLMRAEPVVREIAWDVSEHFRLNWQGTPFKAQLVSPRKETALLYKRFLDEFGAVKSEVVISGPDDREGEESIYDSPFEEATDPVKRFWKSMVGSSGRFSTEKEYNDAIINAFVHGDPSDPDSDAPEIIIVVDKLLTGFDAPCNTVLYLARKLTEHTLLQAIARVNRVHEGKDFGYILDYRGVLEGIDEAIDLYAKSLEEYEQVDLEGTLTDVRAIVGRLPQKHSDLWDTFKEIPNKRDEEAYERLLADEQLRVQFYERFTEFARCLSTALSTSEFLERTPDHKVTEYQRDARFFQELRHSVRRRYAESIDFSEYEGKIRKLLDAHLGVEGVEQITPGHVDLFNEQEREEAIGAAKSDAAKADVMLHNAKRVLDTKWRHEDPAFYRKFSKMIEEAIEQFRADRLREVEYLQVSRGVMEAVVDHTDEDTPEALAVYDAAKAYYGSVKDVLAELIRDEAVSRKLSVEMAPRIEELIRKHLVVNWKEDRDVQNRIRQDVEDYLFEIRDREGFELPFGSVDRILDECLEIAVARSG